MLSGRTLTEKATDRLRIAIRRGFEASPVETQHRLNRAAEFAAEVRGMTGSSAAERRAELLWSEASGAGVFSGEDDPIGTTVGESLSVWTKDDTERLAVTEMDIEGFIRFGSLCREVQDGGPLRISIADRLHINGVVEDHFHTGNRLQKVAILSIGSMFWALRDRWAVATYADQQAWVRAAPLPAPMTGTSVEYLDALLAGDVLGHAHAMHAILGPLGLKPAPASP
jgi:hypothetical protein